MNKKNITALIRGNRVAHLIQDECVKRDLGNSEIDIEEIEMWVATEYPTEERADIIKAVRAMERLDLIKFIVGRRGSKSRIKWQVKPEEIVSIDENVEAQLTNSEQSMNIVQGQSAEASPMIPQTELVSHVFYLRPRVQVSFSLPVDLTEAEVERLTAFLKTLPFDAEV